MEKCLSCHGRDRDRRPSGRLSLVTFAGLARGGARGPAIVAGDATGSLLVKKLKGTAEGERMPKEQPPLADDALAKIEQWITEGAKFDGLNERQDLAQLKPPAKTEQAEGKPPAKTDQTPGDDPTAAADATTAAREKAAVKNWELGMPGVQAARAETKHFLLLGNVSQPTLQQNGELAESLLAKVAEFFVASADEPLGKGRVTLFLLEKRSDYTQFGTLVEKRRRRPSGVATGPKAPPTPTACRSCRRAASIRWMPCWSSNWPDCTPPAWASSRAGSPKARLAPQRRS